MGTPRKPDLLRLLAAFVRKELTQVLRDRRAQILLIVTPLIQVGIYGLALSNETRNIRLAVYAQPGDSLAWELGRRAQGGGYFQLVPAPQRDPVEAIRSGAIDAALVAPPHGLTWDARTVRQGAQLLVDGTNTVRAGGITGYLSHICADVSQERLPKSGPLRGPPPYRVTERVLYNPSLETRNFTVPGVLAMLVLMVTLGTTSVSMSMERERGTLETLLSAPVPPGLLLLGKSIPYCVLGFAEFTLLLLVSHFGFDVPVRGPLLGVAAAALAFVACCVALGLLISTVAKTQQQAVMATFLSTFPTQMLSGITYPLENMPSWLYPITYLNPLRYYVILDRNLLLKGGSAEAFVPNMAGLVLLTALFLALTRLRFRETLN
jgi:ABC-2 type transport system permease protein